MFEKKEVKNYYLQTEKITFLRLMKKRLLHIDTILATILVLVVFWSFSNVFPVNIFEPGKLILDDYDITDVVSSRSVNEKTSMNGSIVIVNSGDTDRAGIAAILQKINAMQPAAIGLDILFDGLSNPSSDSLLSSAVASCKNLVLASEITPTGKANYGMFHQFSGHSGYVNFFGESNSVTRYFTPFHVSDTFFAAAIVNLDSPNKVKALYSRKNKEEMINYSHGQTEFLTFDYRDLINNKVDKNALAGKIVLVGFCPLDRNNIEDKHFTPMNKVLLGRSLPDTYGIVILANVISMIESGTYINSAPPQLNFIVSVLVLWLCVCLFLFHLSKEKFSHHLIIKVWQTLIVFGLSVVDIGLFKYAHIKFDITLPVVLVVLSAEILILYEIIIKSVLKKINYNSIFKHK